MAKNDDKWRDLIYERHWKYFASVYMSSEEVWSNARQRKVTMNFISKCIKTSLIGGATYVIYCLNNTKNSWLWTLLKGKYFQELSFISPNPLHFNCLILRDSWLNHWRDSSLLKKQNNLRIFPSQSNWKSLFCDFVFIQYI